MASRDDFYGRPLYNADLWQWVEIAKEYIPHFMFYTDNPDGSRYGFCTYCGSSCCYAKDDVSMDIYTGGFGFMRTKHGDFDECPWCMYPVRFIESKRMRSFNSLQRVHRLIFSDYIDKDHVNFYAVRVTNMPESECEEQLLDFEPASCYELSPGSVKMYRFRDGDWRECKTYYEPFQTYFGHGGDYEFVLLGHDCDFTDTFLQYSMYNKFEDLGRSKQTFYGDSYFHYMTYLCDYCMYPQIEFLMKAKAYSWVYDLVYDRNFNRQVLNWKAKSYSDMFGLSKPELKAFLSCNLSASLLRLYKELNGRIPFVDLCYMFSEFSAGFHNQLVDLCVQYDIKIQRLCNYFNKNMIPRDRHNSCLYDSTFQMWRDYIEACEKLDVDLSQSGLLFPKDLVESHDARVAQVLVIENAALPQRAQRSLERRDKQYCFEDDRFMIYIPHTPAELIAESNMQENCVAKRYTEKHFREECTICFLREKRSPKESLYTIEMHGKTVYQKHGYLNDTACRALTEKQRERWEAYMSKPLDAADAFYKKWLSWLKAGSPRDAAGRPVTKSSKERKRA